MSSTSGPWILVRTVRVRGVHARTARTWCTVPNRGPGAAIIQLSSLAECDSSDDIIRIALCFCSKAKGGRSSMD